MENSPLHSPGPPESPKTVKIRAIKELYSLISYSEIYPNCFVVASFVHFMFFDNYFPTAETHGTYTVSQSSAYLSMSS